MCARLLADQGINAPTAVEPHLDIASAQPFQDLDDVSCRHQARLARSHDLPVPIGTANLLQVIPSMPPHLRELRANPAPCRKACTVQRPQEAKEFDIYLRKTPTASWGRNAKSHSSGPTHTFQIDPSQAVRRAQQVPVVGFPMEGSLGVTVRSGFFTEPVERISEQRSVRIGQRLHLLVVGEGRSRQVQADLEMGRFPSYRASASWSSRSDSPHFVRRDDPLWVESIRCQSVTMKPVSTSRVGGILATAVRPARHPL